MASECCEQSSAGYLSGSQSAPPHVTASARGSLTSISSSVAPNLIDDGDNSRCRILCPCHSMTFSAMRIKAAEASCGGIGPNSTRRSSVNKSMRFQLRLLAMPFARKSCVDGLTCHYWRATIRFAMRIDNPLPMPRIAGFHGTPTGRRTVTIVQEIGCRRTSKHTFDASGNEQRELSPTGERTTTTWNFENQPTLCQFPHGTPTTSR
jgi:hypothetical protein